MSYHRHNAARRAKRRAFGEGFRLGTRGERITWTADDHGLGAWRLRGNDAGLEHRATLKLPPSSVIAGGAGHRNSTRFH